MNIHRLIGTIMALIPSAGQFYAQQYGFGFLIIFLLAGCTYVFSATMGLLSPIIYPIMLIICGFSFFLYIFLYKKPDEINGRIILVSIGRGLIGAILLVVLMVFAFASAYWRVIKSSSL